MTYVITEPCIDTKDQSCAGECPVDCIYEGDRMMYIHPEECIDCGACVDVCPVTAIVMEYDLTPENKVWQERNEAVFVEIGSPGGAKRHGPLGTDHPAVADVPPSA